MRDDIFVELSKLASEVSKKTSQLDEIMQALQNIHLSIGDREKLQKLINHMAKFNKPKPVTPPPASKPATTSPTNKQATSSPANEKESLPAGEPKGDFLYDVFNSPAMLAIIKEHYSKKKKR